jgi:hypothetical protein
VAAVEEGGVVGYVYLARAGDLHKIGKSIHPNVRMGQIKKPYGRPVIVCLIPCDRPLTLEHRLHQHFKDKCVGGEWFRLDAADIDFFSTVAGCTDLPPATPRRGLITFRPSGRAKELIAQLSEWYGLNATDVIEVALRTLAGNGPPAGAAGVARQAVKEVMQEKTGDSEPVRRGRGRPRTKPPADAAPRPRRKKEK